MRRQILLKMNGQTSIIREITRTIRTCDFKDEYLISHLVMTIYVILLANIKWHLVDIKIIRFTVGHPSFIFYALYPSVGYREEQPSASPSTMRLSSHLFWVLVVGLAVMVSSLSVQDHLKRYFGRVKEKEKTHEDWHLDEDNPKQKHRHPTFYMSEYQPRALQERCACVPAILMENNELYNVRFMILSPHLRPSNVNLLQHIGVGVIQNVFVFENCT